MLSDPWFYAVAIPAVMILGLGKGGLSGLGMLATPLMALAVSPVQAASIILPILLVQDTVGIWLFRKQWDGRSLAELLPGAVIGIGLGYLLAARISPAAVQFAIGLTSLAFVGQHAWTKRKALPPLRVLPYWLGAACGVTSGFTSQLAHAGGPPVQIYLLAKRFHRDTFTGTIAIFFAAVNWLKVPAYAALGQLTAQNLATAAALLPLAVASAIFGAVLVRRVPASRFQQVAYTLLALVGTKLIWDGARALAS